MSSFIRPEQLLKNEDNAQLFSLLYSTDLDLTAQKIVEYYKVRFQIEFVFRDTKQHLGLTNVQSCKRNLFILISMRLLRH